MKEDFSIIQALCRAIVSSDQELVKHQLSRLADAYSKGGYEKESKSIRGYIGRIGQTTPMESINLSVSSAIVGETLTSKVPIPVDKETSAPLLEVFFDSMLPQNGPLFNESVKEAVDSLILEWLNYEGLMKAGASPSRACLIYGVPGTGKTHLAKWIGHIMGLPVVLARLDGLVSSFLGTSSRNIRKLFDFANRYKCILLLDEFDALAKLRDDPQEIGEVKRVVNTLLQNMDERNEIGFTIGITNNPKLLDPAVWRRFDAQIEIPIPNSQSVRQILNGYLKPLSLSEAEDKFVSWCLQGSTGADIEKLANWLKRMKIIPQYKDDSLAIMMRRYSLLNTGRIAEPVKKLLEHDDNDAIALLSDDESSGLKKKDIAEIFKISPSSLSKQLSKQSKNVNE